MYRVLIVDDELLMRIGLESIIEWNEYGFEIAGTADSGEAAMAFLQKEAVDVVLTDVVMHGMDGVSLTRLIKQDYPNILIVALSCYTDVDYVKNIIKMGAEDYLQKLSMTPEQIVDVAKTLKEQLDKRKFGGQSQDAPQPGAAVLQQLILDQGFQLQPYHEEMLGVSELQCLRAVQLRVCNLIAAGDGVTENAIGHLCRELVEGYFLFTKTRNGVVAGLILDRSDTALLKISKDIQDRADRYLDIQLSIGISQPFESLTQIRTAVKQAGKAALYWYLDENNHVFIYEQEDVEISAALFQMSDDVKRYLDMFDFINAEQKAVDMAGQMCRHRTQAIVSRQIITTLLTYVVRFSVENQISLEGHESYSSLVNTSFSDIMPVQKALSLLRSLISYVATQFEHSPKRYRPEIQHLIVYIQEHYMENLTLPAAAAVACMSESHLSSLFKRETGQSFIHYLEECRIRKAVALMRRTRQPLYAIAQQVGYPNVNYFGRVFKKIHGQSPREFMLKQNREQNR